MDGLYHNKDLLLSKNVKTKSIRGRDAQHLPERRIHGESQKYSLNNIVLGLDDKTVKREGVLGNCNKELRQNHILSNEQNARITETHRLVILKRLCIVENTLYGVSRSCFSRHNLC